MQSQISCETNSNCLAKCLPATTLNGVKKAVTSTTTFQVGDFVTYSQDSWGTLNTSASQLLLNRFFDVSPNGVEVGIAGGGGNSAIFTTPESILDFLPTSGPAFPFDKDSSDPTSTSAGVFGGYVIALQLNVDFNDAGVLAGSTGIPFGDLVVVNLSTVPDMNGQSVRQVLAAANTCLGGGSCLPTVDGMAQLAFDLQFAFEGGTPTPFAQDHLLISTPTPSPVPEPGTLSLLGVGVVTMLRRVKRQKRSSG